MLLAGTFTSCEKVAEELQSATEVTINTDLEVPMVLVPESAKSTNATFKETAVINLSENEDLKEYLSDIKSIEVTKILIKILSSDPTNLTLESGNFSIKDDVNGDSFSFSTPANSPLIAGTQLEFGPTTPGWSIVNAIINSQHSATLTAVGSINNETFTVGFNYVISLKATASLAK